MTSTHNAGPGSAVSGLRGFIGFTLLFLAGLLVGGCGTVSIKDVSGIFDKNERMARELVASGRFREAAEVYLRMASQASPPRSRDHILAAAGSYLDAGDPNAAKGLLEGRGVAGWTAEQKAHRDLLTARIILAGRHPEEAFASLRKLYSPDCQREENEIPPHLPSHCNPVLPRSLWPDFFWTRALAHAMQGGEYTFDAIRDRVALDMLVSDPSSMKENHRAIWPLLSSLSASFLSRAYLWPPELPEPVPLRVELLRGWLTLALIVKKHGMDPRSGSLPEVLASWRKQYPGHPAGRFLLKELLSGSRSATPAHIALLLPLDGDFAGAAKAIHDGFLVAWLKDNEDADRPLVTIRNTVGTDIEALYREVVDAGAEFVVGPLDKRAVARLERLPALRKPTLMLNHPVQSAPGQSTNKQSTGRTRAGTSRVSPVPSYQFTLDPESEAKQVAWRARRDGCVRAAILTPATGWGKRMETAFTSAWEPLGGTVVDSQAFPEKLEKISISVQKLLGDVEHLKSAPEDAPMDCILMAAFPREARQVRPQLNFHHASEIPVYATSHVFGGTVDPVLDQDINGIIFGDMPWVLEKSGSGAELRNTVTATWPEFAPRYIRYYALGIDAYRIIPRLAGLRAGSFEEFQGKTGGLSVDGEGRVNRKLLWARMKRGRPVISK